MHKIVIFIVPILFLTAIIFSPEEDQARIEHLLGIYQITALVDYDEKFISFELEGFESRDEAALFLCMLSERGYILQANGDPVFSGYTIDHRLAHILWDQYSAPSSLPRIKFNGNNKTCSHYY